MPLANCKIKELASLNLPRKSLPTIEISRTDTGIDKAQLFWSVAYGRSENDADIIPGSSYDWTQHALQPDAHLSYAYAPQIQPRRV